MCLLWGISLFLTLPVTTDYVFAVPSSVSFPSGRPVVVMSRERSASGHNAMITNVQLNGNKVCVMYAVRIWQLFRMNQTQSLAFSLHNTQSFPVL